MPRDSKCLTEKITIQVTMPMLADLQNVATKSGKQIAEIVRQAIRNALDETDLTLGTRRTFDRRFQQRLDDMEKRLEKMMEEFLQRRSKDSEMAERYFQILAMLYARFLADVPVPDRLGAHFVCSTRRSRTGAASWGSGSAKNLNNWRISSAMSMSFYTDWKFIRTGRGAYGKAKGLLKYLTFRDDRDHHIPRAGSPDRWVDCGLGGSWREIMDSVDELQSQQVLMRSLVIRPPQELIAQLEEVDPELWARRRELLSEVVEHVMEAEMERAGVEWPGGKQPLDLPYSYVIHAPDDAKGIESLHAHVITAAMDRNREEPFNVYPKDTQHTREMAERETERVFQLEKVRDRELGKESREAPDRTWDWQPDENWRPSYGDREIELPDFHGMDM